MRIQHNIAALNSHRNLTNNNSAVSKNLEKLSSGYRINRAGDDAAGLAISEKMRAQITGLQTAQKNAEDGIGLVQTAEGALTEVHSMLNRMVELATQSANGTYENKNRDEMQKEIDALNEEIERISNTSNFNGKKLFKAGATEENPDGGNPPAAAPVQVTDPTSVNVANTPGSTSAEAEYTFDFAGIVFDKAGVVTVTIGDVDVDVDVTEDMLSEPSAFAGAFANAFNALALEDTDAGKFEATATGSGIVIKAETKAEEADHIFGASAPTTFSVAGKDVPTQQDEGDDPVAGNPVNVVLHVGESAEDANSITVTIEEMSVNSLGLEDLKIDEQELAKGAITTINNAIDKVSGIRSSLGAMQNRLEHTINNLGVQTENITAAEARIRDVDMAKEMMTYTKNNILVQASQAMLAQANQVPQGVLQLLQ